MTAYVALFDSNYLTRGLVMYLSLLRCEPDFHLWIICFDDLMWEILTKMNLEKVTLIPLNQFENQRLLEFKSTRPKKEYFFTCVPASLLYILNNFPEVEVVTYLDTDLMFFYSPKPIFAENPDASILLTEHRFLSYFHQPERKYGRFNVQFMMFRRTNSGLEALNYWFERCLELRYESEDDNYGDQKCLDDWQQRFDGVHVIQNLGVGLAPWNASQYTIEKKDKTVFVEKNPLIFYHYSGFKIYGNKFAYLSPSCPFKVQKNIRNFIYKPYFNELKKTYKDLRKIDKNFNKGIENLFFPENSSEKWYKRLKFFWYEIRMGRYYLEGIF